MSDQIKAGDTVRLKSGGPLMTVAWVKESTASCDWFDGSKAVTQSFQITSLELDDGDSIL